MNDLSQGDKETDPLYYEAVRLVITKRTASVSQIQRSFKLGYSRAVSIIEKMKETGLIDFVAENGSYTVLVSSEEELLTVRKKGTLHKLCVWLFKHICKK